MDRIKKTLSSDLLQDFLEKMLLCRKFEEAIYDLYISGKLHGTAHLGIGEEATAVGTCLALKEQDFVLATHRGHSQALAKGMNINAMMAEILGKETGACKGKGGSMHIADIDAGVLVANGVLAANAPIACGAALTIKKRGEDKIVACFYGDGASNLGAIHESMNLAATWNLPVLFVLTNNGYGISTKIEDASRDTDLEKRAYPFSIPAKTLDGNDCIAVYEAVREAREYVRQNGPMLLVLHTYRVSGHSKSDKNLYRSEAEIAAWQEKCPILRLKQHLREQNICSMAEIENIETETTAVIEEALRLGELAPRPLMETITTDVYA